MKIKLYAAIDSLSESKMWEADIHIDNGHPPRIINMNGIYFVQYDHHNPLEYFEVESIYELDVKATIEGVDPGE